MAIGTRAEYAAELRAWASRTRSEPLDSWEGPGEYGVEGWFTDEGKAVVTLEKL